MKRLRLGKLFDCKNYFKRFDILFGIWVPNWVESGQLICLQNKTNHFLKLNTVNVVPFGKPNKKWFGFQHAQISDVWAVRFVWFKKLDHLIKKIPLQLKHLA